MKRTLAAIVFSLVACLAYLLVAWRLRERRVATFDAAAVATIWQLRPRLTAFATTLRSSEQGPRGHCGSPIPATFPICQRDGKRILLLHAASPDADEMHPLHGLLYDLARENASHAGSWYVDRLLEPLGNGWYHVRALPGLD